MIFACRPVVVLLVALAVTTAACGSSDADTQAPSGAGAVLRETFGPGKPVRSGQVDLAVTVNAAGLPRLGGPLKLSLTGPFQSRGGTSLPAFAFDAGLTAGGTTFTAGAVSTGQAGFVTLQGTAYALTAALFDAFSRGYGESATRSGQKRSGPSLSTLGVDPLRWLENPRTVGTERVRGVGTTHVSATVDVPRLLTDVDTLLGRAGRIGGAAGGSTAAVPERLTAAQRRQITVAIKRATFDVWSGDQDRTLRKLDVRIAFDVPQADRAASAGLRKGTLGITLTIAGLNEEQKIAAPPDARPFSALQAEVAQLFGGGSRGPGSGSGATGPSGPSGSAPGNRSAPGGGAGTAPPPTTVPPSAYVECLQGAGQDIVKVNACAKLLTDEP